jgi:hypothetical protein
VRLESAIHLVECELLVGHLWISRDVIAVCASDMMSDVLSFAAENSLLITSLNQISTVRTAHIAEIAGIIYVRGKVPNTETIELAKEFEIPLMSTEFSMYETCGILYRAGLPGVLFKTKFQPRETSY